MNSKNVLKYKTASLVRKVFFPKYKKLKISSQF